MARALWWSLVAPCLACNALDHPLPEGDSRLVIPTDVRPAVVAERKPPPVSGGTLLVTRDGRWAVASDPERDAIVVVEIATGAVAGAIALAAGDEPGRLVEDELGRVHVALRSGGAVVTVEPATRTVLDRRAVCGAPRGIALSTPETLAVACADGKLVTLPAGPGAVTSSLSLESDLRDVVVSDGRIGVTRFKAAELVRLDPAGAFTRRDRPTPVTGTRLVTKKHPDGFVEQREVVEPFRPLVAWRALAGPNGSTVIVHQRAVDATVDITPPSENGSSYGGGEFSCSGIAQNAVTVVGPNGATTDVTFMGAPLPVDATLLPDGYTLLVAHAGLRDPRAPRPFMMFEGEGVGSTTAPGEFASSGSVTMLSLPAASPGGPSAEGTVAPNPGCTPSQTVLTSNDAAVAVAFNPSNPRQIVVQTRQPSSLVVIDDLHQSWITRTIPFDDGSTLDTGFQLFHRDSGGGIACATCHAEGTEDGNVWRFSGFGKRRTQALHIGLEGTAPFHWDGALRSVDALMEEVFVGRMGGIRQSPERLDVLRDWIFALKPPVPLRRADEPAVVRGKALFDSPATQCSACHSGEHFTNNATLDVGTASHVPLQVPSLVGIGHRAPFMHDGCAPTLAARFEPACGGGERHGRTAHLSAEEREDLVAYLESL